MGLRSRMHPRNIYKTPPNFKELAIQFPEFRKYIIQDLSGRVSLDYNDRNAVRELTKVLLLRDFNLQVEINESRLIPRVPVCLNYILWIEDLLSNVNSEQVTGIDIGTGSVCIYSLLASTKGWKMLATEIDQTSFENACNNVKKNKLNDKITVTLVQDPNSLLKGIIDENQVYDFCMCNPPFFDNNEKPQNRTRKRKIIETTASFVNTDVVTSGGEVSFIKKLIAESEELKDKVKIFTTLVGKKADFLIIKKEITNIKPVAFTSTEFCQGNTTRWGIAWSFMDLKLDNPASDDTEKSKKQKTKLLQYVISTEEYSLAEANEKLKKMLLDLKVSFVQEEISSQKVFTLKAYENTWSHQRRKNRLKKQEQANKADKEDGEEEEVTSSKKPKLENKDTEDVSNKPVLVECLLTLKQEDDMILLEMSWLSGNKESVHQIFQFIKNNWSKVTGSNDGEET
ncbi:UNVERIFIED_CONTAM: hypothetical protein PYX00_005388 [Menopon gallinae]|uniref:U6 small nuclear RNA (adenine-(43)-N(6))-methyltransferase n=1 Tax=Menopon gallinae TaxID=328185 RepID=A0AAW2HSU7_9NEOP